MHPKERIGQLLAEASRTLGLPRAQPYAGTPAWRLAFDEHTCLDVEYDPGTHRVMVSADVGAIPPSQRTRLMEVLLQYNFLWTETGGVRMALDGDDLVVAMLEIPEADQQPEPLAALLADMAGVQRAWRAVLDPCPGTMAGPGDLDASDGLHFAIKA